MQPATESQFQFGYSIIQNFVIIIIIYIIITKVLI